MVKEYYSILEVTRTANEEKIKSQYRWLATKNHPSRHKDDQAKAMKAFTDIAEAFEVLSDPKKRGVYDMYGERGLKSGVVGPTGALVGGYHFSTDPMELYNRVFGSECPFGGPILAHSDSAKPAWQFERLGAGETMAELEVPISIPLHLVYTGGRVPISYTRQRLQPSGRTTFTEEKTIVVDVKSDWVTGARLRLAGEGNEDVGKRAGDAVVLITVDEPFGVHREEDDLIVNFEVALGDALCGHVATITRLDGSVMTVSIPNVVSPGQLTEVKNEGFVTKTDGRGSLYIKSVIVFPEAVDERQRDLIRKAKI